MNIIKDIDKTQGRISVQTETDKVCPFRAGHQHMLVVRDEEGKLPACTCLTCLLKKLTETYEIDEIIKSVAMSRERY